MQFTLQSAADATGKAKSTIQRAIKSGKLSATRKEDGSYSIDAAELTRVYPLQNAGSDTVAMKQHAHHEEADLLQVKVALLEQQVNLLMDERNDLRRRLDSSDDERRKLLALLTTDKNERKDWFKFWNKP